MLSSRVSKSIFYCAMSLVLTWMLYHVAQRSDIQEHLRSEIQNATANGKELLTLEILSTLRSS